jgi:WD40 repeat protein
MIIKIWELVNNKYQNVTILMNQNNDILFEQKFSSIIYLEDKNMLISCYRGISFWNCNNFELIYYDNINFSNSTDLCRINEDEIIVYEGYENNNLMKIFSISKKKLIKIIRNSFKLFSILPLKNDFFLVGGNNLSLYNNKNLIPIEYIFNKKLDYRDFNGKLCLNIINGEYETIKKICLFKDNQILITYNSKNLLIEIDL